MKLNQLLEFDWNNETEYTVSSFGYESDSTDDDSGGNPDMSRVYLPSHVRVASNAIIRLVQDGETVMEDEWKNVKRYLKKNFQTLTGSFDLADQKGNVIHSFQLSSN